MQSANLEHVRLFLPCVLFYFSYIGAKVDIEQEIITIKALLIELIELIKIETTIDKYKLHCKIECKKDCSSYD